MTPESVSKYKKSEKWIMGDARMAFIEHAIRDGVFDQNGLETLAEAFDKAKNRLSQMERSEIDGSTLARHIVEHAKTGEMEPEFLWRAAVMKTMLDRIPADAQD